MLISSPFSTRFKSTKSAWLTVTLIVLVSMILNLWVLFLLEINTSDKFVVYECDVKQEFDQIYLWITLAYIAIKMLLPIIIIFVCNFLIIFYIASNSSQSELLPSSITYDQRNRLRENRSSVRPRLTKTKQKNESSTARSPVRVKPYYLSINQVINRETNNAKSSRMLTRMIVLISLTYALLNLPVNICLFFGK